MNFAQIHLAINHLPIFGLPIALIFLFQGLRTKNEGLQRFSLLALGVLALSGLAVFLTGEPAEEVVEHVVKGGDAFIEAHEEAGEVAMVLCTLTGILATLAFLKFRAPQWKQKLLPLVILAGVISTGTLLYTASLGGKIRHTEIRVERR